MRRMRKKDTLACQVSLGLFAGLLGLASTAHGMPIHDGGGEKHDGVRAGGATVTPSGNTMNITSEQENNVIGWKDFSIKKNETVQFDNGEQKNNYLNIVTGNVTSHIDGTMKGGKNVYIANTHGVIFGKEAKVDVGSLYVTTREMNIDQYKDNAPNMTTTPLIEASAAKKEADASARADIVSLADENGSLKANKIVMEGKSVRILNDAAIKSEEVYALSDTRALTAGDKTVRSYTGYVHIGYSGDTKPTSGNGTDKKYRNLSDDNMYKLVKTKDELNDINKSDEKLKGNYMLHGDIDLGGAQHNPIGTAAKPFTGKFDGMFHKIKNLQLGAGTASEMVGLFGTTKGATIMNVGLEGADLSGVTYGGGLVGHAKENTVLSVVYNEGTTSGKKIGKSGAQDTGGIVGKLEDSSLDNAYNTMDIQGSGVAGLVGNFHGKSKIYAVYNKGKTNGGNAVFGTVGSTDEMFVKDAYTTEGSSMGSTDSSAHTSDSYVIGADGKARLTTNNNAGVSSDAKQANTYANWDISDEGGANKTWRIFAGQSTPLLTAFMQGTVQAEYSYADFSKPDGTHSGGSAGDYTKKLASSTPTANNGKSVTRTYDATARRAVKKDGTTAADDISDFNIVGTHDNGINISANQGRRNAGTSALLHSDQHGYDIAGANVTIEKREVKGKLGTLQRPIEKTYDGNNDAKEALKKALYTPTGKGLETEGLIDGDDVKVNTDKLTATFDSEDAGYNRDVTVGGKLTFTGADADNYKDIDAKSLDFDKTKKLSGNILQKEVTLTLNPKTGIDKVYDGRSSVKDTFKQKDTLTLEGVLDADKDKAKLNDYASADSDNGKIKVNYKKEKKTDAENAKNAGNHNVAYSGIVLEGDKAKNYKLVDKEGNVLYRQRVQNDKEAEMTSGGTIWGEGVIKRRNINQDTFQWNGGAATKVYDGTTEWVQPNGAGDAGKKISAKKSGEAGVNADEGLIADDVDKIDFTLAGGKGEFRKDDKTTATKNVSEAKRVAYKVTAKNKDANDDVLSNYTIGGNDAEKGSHDVTGEGKITPRVIDVELLKKTGIDKTYDGKTDVVEGEADDRKYLTMGKGYVGYANGSKTLVGDDKREGKGTDGATINVKAVYKTQAGATEKAAKDVSRDAAGKVRENGKDVEYTFTLQGDNGHAATNYTFNADGKTKQDIKAGVKGTGTIQPKELKAEITKVTRAYNNTSEVSPSQIKYYALKGIIDSDLGKVTLNTEDSGPIKGDYYKNGEKVKNSGTDYDVKYRGLSKALAKGSAGDESGNYWIKDEVDGKGDITKAILNKNNFKMLLQDRVTKTYDLTKDAKRDGLKEVTVDGTKLKEGTGYEITRDGTEYYNKADNTGDFTAPNANVGDDGTTLHNGAKAYGVKYRIKLLGDVANNYDLSGLAGGDAAKEGKYEVDGSHITFSKDSVGYIKSRRIYVGLGGAARAVPKKVYDGTTKLMIDGASTGEALLNFGNGGQADAGVLKNSAGYDEVGNGSTGAYENRNAGKEKENYSQRVVYTPKITGGVKTNYVFYHAPNRPNTPQNPYAMQKWDPVERPITGEGTITPRDLLVTAPNDVKRQYNGDVDVNKNQGKLQLDKPLIHESAPGKNDAATAGETHRDKVGLNEIDETKDGSKAKDKYYRHYISPDANVEDTDENKAKRAKYVTYRRIQLTGEDAGNYRLVYRGADAENKPLDKDTMTDAAGNPYYTMSGMGIIEKRKVTSDKLHIGLKTGAVKKVYDGNHLVQGHDGKGFVSGKKAKENKELWKNLVQESYVEGEDGRKINFGIASVNDAEYLADGTDPGKRAKDVGKNKRVRLNVTFDKEKLKNFDIEELQKGSDANGKWLENGSYDYYKIKDGEITKKTLRVNADAYARKVYDGTSKVTDIKNHLHLQKEDIVKEDGKDDDVSLEYGDGKSEGIYKKGGGANSQANIDPFAKKENGYDVEYTLKIKGADKDNYAFMYGDKEIASDGKIQGKGDIERRMVFADTVNPKLEKYYDGKNDATRYSKDTNRNENIEDKDIKDANNAKSARILKGEGANFSDGMIKNRATGLVDGDTWSAKGEFDNKNAGDNKKVTYKITLSDGDKDNYRIYKKSDLDQKLKENNAAPLNNVVGTALARDGADKSAKLEGVGEIKKANLLVKADAAQKVYDGTKKTDTVEGGILNKLTLDGIYYDTTKDKVKDGGAYEDTTKLNKTKGKDEYRAEYRDPNVKPKDGKGDNEVNYSHLHLEDSADPSNVNNYNLVYKTKDGIKNLEADNDAGYYKMTGAGKINPLEIDNAELDPSFNPDAITKTYDGNAKIKDAKGVLKKSKARVKVRKKATGEIWDITDIEDAYSADGEYLDTKQKKNGVEKILRAKDVGKDKDVKFTFTMDPDNFIYKGAGGKTTIEKTYEKKGAITARKVRLNVQDVQKIYDATTDVKHGYYEGYGSNLKEYENQNVDHSKLVTAEKARKYTAEDEKANKDHKAGTWSESGLIDGVTVDSGSLSPKYSDKKANRAPQVTSGKKDVFYKLRLNGDDAANYEFEVYDGNNMRIDQTKATEEYNLVGRGDIWYRKVEFNLKGLDKKYDGSADLRTNDPERLKELKDQLYLKSSDGKKLLSLDDEAAKKIRGKYGDRNKDAFEENSHVKRRNGNTGEVIDRDVQLEGLYEAFKSMQDRDITGDGASNYFYNGYIDKGVDEKGTYVAPNETAYAKGKILPKTVKLNKTWLGGFEKPYDGTSLAKIKGSDGKYYSFAEASTIGKDDTAETKKIKQEVKQKFYDKLKLSINLGTGEGAIDLDYKLYGDAEGDDPANMPYYENPTTKKRDANVHNDSALKNKKKDIVYRLKDITTKQKYKDWDIDPSDMEARLLDGTYKPDGTTDGASPLGYTATITPRKITVDEKNNAPIAKIYDGTDKVKDLLDIKGKPFDSTHPEFSYKGILETDKGKVKVEATSKDGRFHDRKTDKADKNATVDQKTWADLAKREDYEKYNTEKKSSKVVHYNLTLKSVKHPDNPSDAEKIALGNYEVDSTYDASAEIVKRKIKAELDHVDPKTLTREYDTTTNASVRSLHFSPTNQEKSGVVGDEKVLLKNADQLKGDNKRRGIYDTKNVKRGKNGEVLQNQHNITYRRIELNDDAVSKNYELDTSNLKQDAKHPEYGNILQDKGTITPKGLTFALEREDVQKQYDGTREVKNNAYGNFLKGNIKNNNALWQALEEDGKKIKEFKGTFDSEGASALDANKKAKPDKQVTYDITWENGNYKLLDKDGKDLTKTKVDENGISYTFSITTKPNSATIYRRRLLASPKEAQKVYDGTKTVKNAWENLNFRNIDKDGKVIEQEEGFLSKKNAAGKSEAERAKAILKATYDDPNATAKNKPQELMNHVVEYSFSNADDVLKNYEIFEQQEKGIASVDTIHGTGKIRRRTLNVVSDWKATLAGYGGVNFTGHIADGSALDNDDSPLTREVEGDIREYNDGRFYYAPKANVDYNTPASHEIFGWYRDGGKEASGDYGQNYTLKQVPSRLAIAPRQDGVDRTIRPDSKVYENASYDQNNSFEKYKKQSAGIAYKDRGVNDGSVKKLQASIVNNGTNINGAGKVADKSTSLQEAAQAAGTAGANSNSALASGNRANSANSNSALASGGKVSSNAARNKANDSTMDAQGSRVSDAAFGKKQQAASANSAVDRGLAAATGKDNALSRAKNEGVASKTEVGKTNSRSSVERGLANALGQNANSGANYYSGKRAGKIGDEEEEIKKKTRATA